MNTNSLGRSCKIELVFLVILVLILLSLIGIEIYIYLSLANFATDHPENATGGEWGSLVFYLMLVFILYALVMFLWQYVLWQRAVRLSIRHPIQLSIIFIFCIIPYSLVLLYLFLVNVMAIKFPSGSSVP